MLISLPNPGSYFWIPVPTAVIPMPALVDKKPQAIHACLSVGLGTCLQCLQKPEEGTRSLDLELRELVSLLMWELATDLPPVGVGRLSTTEPPLQPPLV